MLEIYKRFERLMWAGVARTLSVKDHESEMNRTTSAAPTPPPSV